MTCAPSVDSKQSGNSPSLIKVFAVRSKRKCSHWPSKLSSCGQRSLWSDWTDAQADLSLCWARKSFCWFCRAAAQICLHCLSQIIRRLSCNSDVSRAIVYTSKNPWVDPRPPPQPPTREVAAKPVSPTPHPVKSIAEILKSESRNKDFFNFCFLPRHNDNRNTFLLRPIWENSIIDKVNNMLRGL